MASISRKCSVEDCEKLHYGRGFCQPHWKKQYVNPRKCSADSCFKPVDARSLCRTHYHQVWVQENKEHRKNYETQRYLERKEQVAEYNKQYYKANKKHYQEKYSEWAKNNKETRQRINRKTRATKRAAPSEPYTKELILEIYGTNCHLCGKEIDLSAPRRQGSAPNWEFGLQLDHVTPLSKGGTDLIDNIRPSHAVCNIIKQDKI